MMGFEIDIQKYVYAYAYTARIPSIFPISASGSTILFKNVLKSCGIGYNHKAFRYTYLYDT